MFIQPVSHFLISKLLYEFTIIVIFFNGNVMNAVLPRISALFLLLFAWRCMPVYIYYFHFGCPSGIRFVYFQVRDYNNTEYE